MFEVYYWAIMSLNFTIFYSQTENLKPPYATRCGSTSLSHFAEYRQSRCFFEQLSHKIEKECNCRGQFMLGKSLFPFQKIGRSFSVLHFPLFVVITEICGQFPVKSVWIWSFSGLRFYLFINLAKFTGKRLCQGLFFNKNAGLRPATLLKKKLCHRCFFCEFCEVSKNTFSYRAPTLAASETSIKW